MAELTPIEAAARLSVSVREVERLVSVGQLPGTLRVGRNYLLAAEAVERLAAQSRRRGRPWTERTAWAGLALLSGSDAPWMTSAERTRLTHRLRGAAADELQHLARHRAVVHRYRGRSSSLDALVGELVLTGSGGEHRLTSAWGLTRTQQSVDGYLLDEYLGDVVDEFGLIEDVAGNVTLRALTVDAAFVGGETPAAAIALDLSESLNARERTVGRRELAAMLRTV